MKKIIPFLFFGILAIEIYAEVKVEEFGAGFIYLTKTLLMPFLMLYYYLSTKNNFQKFDKIVLGALFFSWWGDNFLMPQMENINLPIHFLAGLGSFLVAHLLYIPAFMTNDQKQPGLLKQKPIFALPFVLLVGSLLYFLFQQNHPDFVPMKIPVVVYATVILFMVLSAMDRKGREERNSFQLIAIGAIMFMISDSFIALSRFSYLFEGQVNFVRIAIMSLYAGGQFLITQGAIYKYKR